MFTITNATLLDFIGSDKHIKDIERHKSRTLNTEALKIKIHNMYINKIYKLCKINYNKLSR